MKKNKNGIFSSFDYLQKITSNINQSKIFAGLVIITLNITSKFVTFKLSKTQESYLKYTFSKNILVFAFTWMGTRDILTSLVMTLIFIIFTDYLLNEESAFCCLPSSFISTHVNKMESMNNMNNVPHDTIEKITKEDVECVEKIIKKLKNYQDMTTQSSSNPSPIPTSGSFASADSKPFV